MKKTIAKKVKAVALVLVMGAGVIGGFAKIAEALTITSVDPEKGPVAGEQDVTIKGDFNQDMKWKQVAAGSGYTCAIASNDQAYCWGFKAYGQLGDGTNTGPEICSSYYYECSKTPVAVLLGDRPDLTVKQITASERHTCVIASNDQAYCWGWNSHGQLGDGTNTGPEICTLSTPCSKTPVAVLLGDRPDLTVKQIVAGHYHTCAIASNDQVYCWGENGSGELGDGTNTHRYTPVAVLLGDRPDLTVKQIAARYAHTCAIASDDQAYCWGYNHYSQLGNGTYTGPELCTPSTPCSKTPVAVLLGDRPNLTVKQISAGEHHTCAIAGDTRVYCWGTNNLGQLGDGTNTGPETCAFYVCSRTPVAVLLGDRPDLTAKQIYVGHYHHTCAIASNDQVYCWGLNGSGQLGDGTVATHRTTPVAVQLGDRSDLAVKQISVGGAHTCAIASNDQVYCWGDNSFGELGDGTDTNRNTPVLVDTSSLPPATYTVTIDVGGTPALCTGVVIATDGKSLKCTTSAHIAGLVDVTVDDGVSAKTLEKGYEYVRDGGGGSIIKDILSPDTGVGRVVGLLVLGEVVVVAVGVAIFFKIRKEEFR